MMPKSPFGLDRFIVWADQAKSITWIVQVELVNKDEPIDCIENADFSPIVVRSELAPFVEQVAYSLSSSTRLDRCFIQAG
jgi:hypothetical protein